MKIQAMLLNNRLVLNIFFQKEVSAMRANFTLHGWMKYKLMLFPKKGANSTS